MLSRHHCCGIGRPYRFETSPCGDPNSFRITRHFTNAAAIRLAFGIERFDLHPQPMIPPVGAAKHASPRHTENRPGTPATCQDTVHVHPIATEILPLAHLFPRLPAIA